MTAKQMEVKGKILKFDNCFVVGRSGMGGGLALLLTSKVKFEVQSYSKHHIDVVIHNENGSFWRCKHLWSPRIRIKKTYVDAFMEASRYVNLAMAFFRRL